MKDFHDISDHIKLEPFTTEDGRLSVRCADTGREVAYLRMVETRQDLESPLTLTLECYAAPMRDFVEGRAEWVGAVMTKEPAPEAA